jgi:RND superfamily putative drug exporter
LVILTEIGFCVAIGVLIDTIIVRSVLVTALNLDLGDRIWWPSLLSRPSGLLTSAPSMPVATARR